MNGNVFVDTNVLVYARDAAFPAKQECAMEWLRRLWKDGTGRIGYQVLNEYLVTVTAKLTPGLPREEAWADVQDLMAWNPRPVDRSCVELAIHLTYRFHLSWWDALIVAAARLEKCSTLLSEDLPDGLVIDELEVVNPFGC